MTIKIIGHIFVVHQKVQNILFALYQNSHKIKQKKWRLNLQIASHGNDSNYDVSHMIFVDFFDTELKKKKSIT